MNNNVIWGIIIAVVVIGGLIWFANANNEDGEQVGAGMGRLFVGVTDATADINNVNEVSVEIEKVEVHSPGAGWVEIDADAQMFNLLELKKNGKTVLFAEDELEVGTYDRIRITFGDATIKTKNNGDIKAHLPGRQTVMNLMVNVVADADTHLELDLLADKSLHLASDKKTYVFAPVVMAESQSSATVNVSADNSVQATGGTTDSSASVGMDLAGSSRTNFTLISDNNLKVDTSGGVIKFVVGNQTFTQTEAEQEEPDSQINVQSGANSSTNTNINANSGSSGSGSGASGLVDVNRSGGVNVTY